MQPRLLSYARKELSPERKGVSQQFLTAILARTCRENGSLDQDGSIRAVTAQIAHLAETLAIMRNAASFAQYNLDACFRRLWLERKKCDLSLADGPRRFHQSCA
jgi:hypothetical protein